MRALFSGVHLKGRLSGSVGTASRCGQLHWLSLDESALHPAFIARREAADNSGASGGMSRHACGRNECLGDAVTGMALPTDGKSLPTTRRSTIVSKERNSPLT